MNWLPAISSKLTAMIFLRLSLRKLAASLILFASLIASRLSRLQGSALSLSGSNTVNARVADAKPYSRKPSQDALKWADKELKRMSLDEKIGQLISVGVNATFLNQDSEAFKALRHQVVDNHVGGIILFRGPVYESVVLDEPHAGAGEISAPDFGGSGSRRGHAFRRHR